MNRELSLPAFRQAAKRCPIASVLCSIGNLPLLWKFKRFFVFCPFLSRYLHKTPVRQESETPFDYEIAFREKIDEKKRTNTYRVFKRIQRLASEFPEAQSSSRSDSLTNNFPSKRVSVWCSNDYLGMSSHTRVIEAAISVIVKHGVGAGGTRNISGNNALHEQLERTLAQWYGKEAGLIFTSCYVANSSALLTLARILPNCVIFSDEENHASMIEGIRFSNREKVVFKHNDSQDLERKLRSFPLSRPKIVAFESINSMSGQVAPIGRICSISRKYGAITFLDEVHATGLYGLVGSGLSEQQGCLSGVDLISGTMGKAVGTLGGFLVGPASFVDVIRSYASGFIFTTALPPSIVASSLESIKVLQSEEGLRLRAQHQAVVSEVRRSIVRLGLPLMPSSSHIIPLLVKDPQLCEAIGTHLLQSYGIYVQPISHPTVRFGTERLRIAPTPNHKPEVIQQLIECLFRTWSHFKLKPIHPECTKPSCDCTFACQDYQHSECNKPIHSFL